MYFITTSIALLVAAIESVSYWGFIANNFSLPSYFYYLVNVVVIWYRPVPRLPRLLLVLAKLGLILATSILLILAYLEVTHYPNYVYTVTHINLTTLQVFVGLLAIHAFILVLPNHLDRKRRLIFGSAIGILVSMGSFGIGKTAAFLLNSYHAIAPAPTLSYEEKLTRAYPGLYPALEVVNKLTPPDSTIIIPPQGNPWEFEGNAAIVRYFIYPRKPINSDFSDIEQLKKMYTKIYVLIAKGSWHELTNPAGYYWPKIPIPANRIWEINPSTKSATLHERPYDPKTDTWDWGLIEVKQ
ncbi:MAG: hypothetical protein E6R05_00365 [Candidatus Moraniibacteriota bacterium]|nr:MAG: hypothetical protein E6R05_00365 [Candidatus Moranbacteria bacterium]